MSKIEIEFKDEDFFKIEHVSKKNKIISFEKDKFILFIEDIFNIDKEYEKPVFFAKLKKVGSKYYNQYNILDGDEHSFELNVKNNNIERKISSPIVSVIENEDYLKVLLPKNKYRNIAFSFVHDKKNNVSYSIQDDLLNIITEKDNLLINSLKNSYRLFFKKDNKFITHNENSISHQFSGYQEQSDEFKYITNVKKIDEESYKVDLRYCQISHMIIKNGEIESFRINDSVNGIIKKNSLFRNKKDMIEKIMNTKDIKSINEEFKDYLELKLLITDQQEVIDFLEEDKLLEIFHKVTEFKYYLKDYNNFSTIYEKIYKEVNLAMIDSDEIFIEREEPKIKDYNGSFIKKITIQNQEKREYFEDFNIENLQFLKSLINIDNNFNIFKNKNTNRLKI